jgi:amidophosphoribosyltransferase
MPSTATEDQITEKCAVFGVCGTGLEAARLAFYGLWALQHRGQESSGIASSDGDQLHRHAAHGLVANVYREEDFEQLPGYMAIGHNRYSTSGGTDGNHTQPFIDYDKQFSFAHNGNLPDCTKLSKFLNSHDISTEHLSDSGMMSAAIGYYLGQGADLAGAVAKAFPLFTGVFSAVAMDKDCIVAFRDKRGIRPMSIATLDGGYVIASETCAFDTIGATYLRDVQPGEMVTISQRGLASQQVVSGREQLDIFEFVYFARPDSQLLGKRVNEVRKAFGRQLARESKCEADVVVPVPDSAIPAALGYAEASGIPFEMGLMKNRYIHRTFIRPTAELRERDLKMKLNPVIETIKDRRVILVDDSIVRGTTLRKVVAMLFEAGAREVHLMISSPPLLYPDFYGINTPDPKELIATRMSVDQICSYVGASSLTYLSYDGMIAATGLPASRFSTSCFNGVYPISIGNRAKEFLSVSERIKPLARLRTKKVLLTNRHQATV